VCEGLGGWGGVGECACDFYRRLDLSGSQIKVRGFSHKTPFLPVMPGHVLAECNNLDSAAQVGVFGGGGAHSVPCWKGVAS
jgi:hypothetical protein